MKDIVHINRYVRDGVFFVDIRGLGIFQANNIAPGTLLDPRIIFLRHLSSNVQSSLHLALKVFQGDSPEESFGREGELGSYIMTTVSVYGNDAYAHEVENCGMFYEQTPESFWSIPMPDSDWGVDLFVVDDALALYCAPIDNGASRFLADLDENIAKLSVTAEYKKGCHIFTAHDWYECVLDYYRFAVAFDNDGFVITVFSKEEGPIDIVTAAIEAAVSSIKSSEWFKSVEPALSWNEDFYSLCNPDLAR